MKILNHPACTHQLGAPSDMQDGSCDALPVMYQTTEHGTFAISFWQPDAEELVELLAGGGIALHVRAPGRQHPVVMVGTFPCPDGFEASGMQMEGLAKRWYGPVREQLEKAQEENKALRDQVAAQRRALKDAEICVSENIEYRKRVAALQNKVTPFGVADCLREAAAILAGEKEMRHPIVDELHGFAGMLEENHDPHR